MSHEFSGGSCRWGLARSSPGFKTEIKKMVGEIGFFFVDEDKLRARKLLETRIENLLSQLEQISKRNDAKK